MVSDDIDPDWPPPAHEPSARVGTTGAAAEPLSSPGSGRFTWLVTGLVVLLCVGAVAGFLFAGRDRDRAATNAAAPNTAVSTNPSSAPSTSPAGNPAACGPDEAGAISAALATVPPDRRTGKQWDRKPESTNYSPCADLSAVVLTVQDSTRSSSDLALLFHRGGFVGTATPKTVPFTSLEQPASTDDVVVLTYRSGQSCDVCTDGTLTTVGFQWKDNKVNVLDALPESLDSP